MKNFLVPYRNGVLKLLDRFLIYLHDLDKAIKEENTTSTIVGLGKLRILREILGYFLPENFQSENLSNMDRHIHFLVYYLEKKDFKVMTQDVHDLLTQDLPNIKEEIDSLLLPIETPEKKIEVSEVVSEAKNYLRFMILKTPRNEGEVQDALEILLRIKGYHFDREKVTIPYSTKSFKPDFTSDRHGIAGDVKLCDTVDDERRIINETNADIPAYKLKYPHLIFIVYDLQIIRDVATFCHGIEENNPDVSVLVIKH